MRSSSQQASATGKNLDAPFHVNGTSCYLDDLPELAGTIYAKVLGSPIAHGRIQSIDYQAASELTGVVRIISYQDIPGENQIGGIIADEPLLAEEIVDFQGQPILLILAESEAIAEVALEQVDIAIEPLPVIIDPREAYQKGHLLSGSRSFQLGDTDTAFEGCEYIFEGTAETGGQEHVYLEPQGAYAIPTERKGLFIYSSTQGPTAVQRTVARILGTSMSYVEVDVNRIGGGFGGKEDQASPWAAMAALGAFLTQKPVKCLLDRKDDLTMTGKRNPYTSDYKIGLDKDFNIVAYEATYYQNGGAAADLSPAILERTLFHGTNSYFVPNVRMTAHSCRTNIAPNTAFRGFGGPQGMFVIEAAIHHASRALGVDPAEIQRKNMLKNGVEFPYGQIVEDCEAVPCWDQAVDQYQLSHLQSEIATYNSTNDFSKKGLALMPICFGISFTNTQMNQARALVHIYSDGSIGVSTGAVEMGQGVNTKMVQIAAQEFGVSLDRIKLETTNTTRVANTSPSAASATADLNGKALKDACQQIRARLFTIIREVVAVEDSVEVMILDEKIWVGENQVDMTWEQLIQTALSKRVSLSAKGHYATPRIHFDKTVEKGHPFAYHVYGTAILISTVDCLRGTYSFDAVKIIHDFGTSMNRAIDLGQIEGGLVQGMGWITTEELMHRPDGILLSNTLANYKIPDIYAVPKEIEVEFLPTDGSDLAIYKSKAVGEPPLMYGIGAYFSIANAVLAFNPKAKLNYRAPFTPEEVLMALYG